jgi:uncharacterized protein (TIGR03437 family)
VGVDVGDPYTIAETTAAPVSTGGTPLGLIGDDEMKTINLPFMFTFYGIEYPAITVSTNGALYFGFPPDEDPFSSPRLLNGRRMIAGLWDDLRTDRRPGDDVYTVVDPDRIIFRWQAVTFDHPISPSETRGENPVSFEIELRYDGTITVRYGDGNQKLFPVVGLSGGAPEPYFSSSHSFTGGLKDLTNAATVVFARRSPIPRGVITVASANPSSGVNITVSPNDISGSGNGTTQFTRTYNPGTTVTLTAPATVNGSNFQRWERNGVDWSANVTTSLVMSGNNVTMTAIYNTPPVLTVTSSQPSSGVNITVTPNDNNGAGDGTTPFTRTYNQSTAVNLTAPQISGTSTFWKWQLDGVDYVQSNLATVTMNTSHTVTALYISSEPTPTPTPVPGAGAQPIAFVKPASGTGSASDIFLTNTDGTNVVNISNAAGEDLLPAWSPDGSRLAYTCHRQPDGSPGGPDRICLRNADGTGLVVLSNTLAQDNSPAWSRDGQKIAFVTGLLGAGSTLAIMNADGTGRSPIQITGSSDPDWSPDGSTLVFSINGNNIWTYNRFTQTQLRLTDATGDSHPHYSPDGTKIVFHSRRDLQDEEIYVMNADGSGQTQLTDNGVMDISPVWSPDGTKILFTSLRDGPMNAALYIMNADGSNPTRVTAGTQGAWRVNPASATPVVFTEQGTGDAAAINSVTYVRGPFKILDPHNFSSDGHTRITLFTSNLGLNSPPIPETSTLSVKANGINLPVEYVGPSTGVQGMNGSYIIVKLPDGLPTGDLSLTITVNGVTSQAATLRVVP